MTDQQRSFAMGSIITVLIFNGILLGAVYYLAPQALDPLLLWGGGALISLLLWLIVLFVGNRAIAEAAKAVPTAQRVAPPPRLEPKPEPKPLPPPSDAPALQLLSILQRKGRLIDFLQENLDHYADDQIGAAVRPIHAGCKEALHDHITLQSIYSESEGSQVRVDAGFDANAVRLIGNVSGEPPFRGTLVHRGWRATNVTLPRQINDNDNDTVIAPAEVEIG